MTKLMAILEMALKLLTGFLQARERQQQKARHEAIKADPKAAFRDQFGAPQRLPDAPDTLPSASGTHPEVGRSSSGDPDPQ